MKDWGRWNPMGMLLQQLCLTTQLIDQNDSILVISLFFHVTPGSRKDKLLINNGVISWKFSAPAIEQKANDYVIATLGKKLGVGLSNVAILRGAKSRDKLVQIIFHLTEHKKMQYYLSKVQAFFLEQGQK